MDEPLVSCIVLCYNQGPFVARTLDGVKAQQYSNVELLIHDDSSSDNSVMKIERWLEENWRQKAVKFHSSSVNKGICKSLNWALKESKGKFISLTAADDIWRPQKLSRQIELFNQLDSSYGVVYSDALQIDKDGNRLSETFLEAHNVEAPRPTGDIHARLWAGNFIPAMTTLIRRECYEKVGVYDESLYYEDYDMWLRIARHFNFYYMPEVTASYRILDTSMVRSQPDKMIDASWQMILKHLETGNLNRSYRFLAAKALIRFLHVSLERKTAHSGKLLGATFRLAAKDWILLYRLIRYFSKKLLTT